MQVIFLNSFKKDIKKIRDKSLKKRLKSVLINLENAETLDEIDHIIKMKNYSDAYRIRIGDYRLGIHYEDEVVIVARFLKRNDIYKVFPK